MDRGDRHAVVVQEIINDIDLVFGIGEDKRADRDHGNQQIVEGSFLLRFLHVDDLGNGTDNQ